MTINSSQVTDMIAEVTNIITERVVRLDTPSYISHPFEFNRSLAMHELVKVPVEPEHFRQWLDAETVRLAQYRFTNFFDYLDRFQGGVDE